MLVSTIVFFIFLIVFSYLVKRSADRFEARKRAAGEWDESGPKHPSRGDERYRVLFFGGNLFSNVFPRKSSVAEAPESRPKQPDEKGLAGKR